MNFNSFWNTKGVLGLRFPSSPLLAWVKRIPQRNFRLNNISQNLHQLVAASFSTLSWRLAVRLGVENANSEPIYGWCNAGYLPNWVRAKTCHQTYISVFSSSIFNHLSPSSKATLNKVTEDSSVAFKRNCQNRSFDLIISISFLDPSPQMYPMFWVHLHLMHPTNQPTHPICAELKQMILIFLVILDQDFFCLLLKFLTNFVEKNKYLFSCFHPTIAMHCIEDEKLEFYAKGSFCKINESEKHGCGSKDDRVDKLADKPDKLPQCFPLIFPIFPHSSEAGKTGTTNIRNISRLACTVPPLPRLWACLFAFCFLADDGISERSCGWIDAGWQVFLFCPFRAERSKGGGKRNQVLQVGKCLKKKIRSKSQWRSERSSQNRVNMSKSLNH